MSTTLIVIASLLLPMAGATVWVRNLALDPSRYVDTVAPLSKNPAVREAVAIGLSSKVSGALEIDKRAKAALPSAARFLAAPIAASAQQLVHNTALRLLQSDAFGKAWRLANQRAHDQIVNALTGRKVGAVTNADGKVVLNLNPLAVAVAKRLGSLGVGVPKNVDVTRLNAKFVLIDSSDLAAIQDYTKLLDKLAWALPLLTLVLYGLAVLIAPRRRKGLLRVGVGITIAMTVSIIGYGLGRTAYLDNLPTSKHGHPAAAAIFDTVTRFVERGLHALLVIGILVWFIAWLAGPSRPAQALRLQWNRAMGHTGGGASGASEAGPASRWIATNATGLRVGLAGLLLALLLVWDRPTGMVILWLAAVGLLGIGLIQLLAAGGASKPVATS